MPAEKCKAGRGMAVGKHTFSLTLVVVTECALYNAQLDECCYDSFHSWVHCSTVRCRNIAFLLGLSEKENCSTISVWCFKTCSVLEVHRQPEAWVATLSLSPHRHVYTILGKCFPSSSKSPACEGPCPPELPVQWLRSSTVRTIFLLLSSPNLSCCNLGLGHYP